MRDSIIVANIMPIVEFNNTQQLKTSLIASDPEEVCFCVDNEVICSVSSQVACVVPGKSFTTNVVVLGQLNGITLGVVQIVNSDDSVNDSTTHSIGASCTVIGMTILLMVILPLTRLELLT